MEVIGLMGTIGAGKGTVAEYLEKNYGFKTITMGDLVREEADRRGIDYRTDEGRKELQNLSEDMKNENGRDYWMIKTIEKIEEMGWDRAVIDGIREPSEADGYKEKLGVEKKIILVDADAELRFKRMKEKRNRPGDPQTLEEFREQEKREWEM